MHHLIAQSRTAIPRRISYDPINEYVFQVLALETKRSLNAAEHHVSPWSMVISASKQRRR